MLAGVQTPGRDTWQSARSSMRPSRAPTTPSSTLETATTSGEPRLKFLSGGLAEGVIFAQPAGSVTGAWRAFREPCMPVMIGDLLCACVHRYWHGLTSRAEQLQGFWSKLSLEMCLAAQGKPE